MTRIPPNKDVFMHRTYDAMKYIPYKLLNQHGEVIEEHNQKAKAIATMYGKNQAKIMLYPAEEGEFAVDMPMLKTRKGSIRRLEKENRFFDSFNGNRVVTPLGIAREMFMLDDEIKDSSTVLMYDDHGPVTVHDIWVFANRGLR